MSHFNLMTNNGVYYKFKTANVESIDIYIYILIPNITNPD